MSYIAIVLIVGLLITIHEWGHLAAAKLCRIPVAQFSIGFGPALIKRQRAETSYRLSVIPIGGYVLAGLDPEALRTLPAHKRITFALGGPLANVAAAFVGLLVLAFTQFDQSITAAVPFAASQLWTGLQQQVAGLSMLLTGVDQLNGIVGIVAVGGQHFASTLNALLTFSVLINISLAVMNMLPLPPLDGGRIVFCLLEKMYRPLGRAEMPLTLAGWAAMLLLMAYVTVQDIGRIITAAV